MSCAVEDTKEISDMVAERPVVHPHGESFNMDDQTLPSAKSNMPTIKISEESKKEMKQEASQMENASMNVFISSTPEEMELNVGMTKQLITEHLAPYALKLESLRT